ncbi:MAG: hypothetical protein RMJ37_01240 [Spirochaetia bacterium]|nr:hypothetical protein [Spirochaetota bacterium]MCX8096970.1 hypothetical protein [Spirochaetota bacterium]MDW8111947.1 hypothetical protein [Spirochaetia bacterium]
MNRIFTSILLVILLSLHVHSYERSGINFLNPSTIQGGSSTYTIKHRFIGPVTNDIIDTFFFLNTGVSMYLEIAFYPIDGLRFHFGYENAFSGYHIGLGYAYDFGFVKPSITVEYNNTKEMIDNNYSRHNNIFSVLSIQSMPIFDVIDFGVNVGYDYLYKGFGLGIFTSIGYLELPDGYKVSLVGEYYPTFLRVNGQSDNFVFGLKIDTYGHHFLFTIGNTYFATVRSSMFGMEDNYLRLGFRIDRIFQWGM